MSKKETTQEEKDAIANSAAEAKAVKEKCVEAYQAEPSEALIQPLALLVDQSVALALGDNFTMQDGDILIKKGKDPLEAFSSGFRNMNELIAKSAEMHQGFAVHEAKLALAAKKVLGDDWPVTMAGATNKQDIHRIKKNMRAILNFQTAGFPIGEVPIGTARALTEVLYDQDPTKNTALMRDAITLFFDESKKKGSFLNQLDARALVNSVTPHRNPKQNWDTFYVISGGSGKKPKCVGSMGLVDEQMDGALLTIDKKNSCVIVRDKDGYVYVPIPTYVGAPSEAALEKQDQPVAPAPQPKPPEPVAAKPEAKAEPVVVPLPAEPVIADVEEAAVPDLDLDSIFSDDL